MIKLVPERVPEGLCKGCCRRNTPKDGSLDEAGREVDGPSELLNIL